MILLEFSKKDMAITNKNKKKVFYTILSIAKSTLFSLYYNCKLFCINLAKTRAVLPSTLKQDFKHILDFEFNPSIYKSIKFFLQQEQCNIGRIQNEENNINSLELYKSFMEKKRKKRELPGPFTEDSEGKWKLPETIGSHTRNKKCLT